MSTTKSIYPRKTVCPFDFNCPKAQCYSAKNLTYTAQIMFHLRVWSHLVLTDIIILMVCFFFLYDGRKLSFELKFVEIYRKYLSKSKLKTLFGFIQKSKMQQTVETELHRVFNRGQFLWQQRLKIDDHFGATSSYHYVFTYIHVNAS